METDSDWGTGETNAPDRAPITTEHTVGALQGVSGSPGPGSIFWKALKACKERTVLVSLFNL